MAFHDTLVFHLWAHPSSDPLLHIDTCKGSADALTRRLDDILPWPTKTRWTIACKDAETVLRDLRHVLASNLNNGWMHATDSHPELLVALLREGKITDAAGVLAFLAHLREVPRQERQAEQTALLVTRLTRRGIAWDNAVLFASLLVDGGALARRQASLMLADHLARSASVQRAA